MDYIIIELNFLTDILCIFQRIPDEGQHGSKANQISLTFFLQECFSGGQGTLTNFWVLKKFYSSGNLEGDKCH